MYCASQVRTIGVLTKADKIARRDADPETIRGIKKWITQTDARFASKYGWYVTGALHDFKQEASMTQVRDAHLAMRTSPAIQKGTRILVSLWDSLMFGRVPKHAKDGLDAPRPRPRAGCARCRAR